jgi:micrococcal nuclease
LDPVSPLAPVVVPVLLAALLTAQAAFAQDAAADSPAPPPAGTAPPTVPGPPSDTGTDRSVPAGPTGVVVRVIDGDTIEVEGLGRVRLLGVDAPESVDPRREVQPFGREAAAYTRARLLGRRVRLEFEPLRRRDRYGRILAYVFLPDGTLFNQRLLADGYAHVYTGHPYARMDAFLEAQREARRAGLGLWGAAAPAEPRRDGGNAAPQPAAPWGAGAPAPERGSAAVPLQPAAPSTGPCDPSYPDLCLPPPPPDLDCRDVPSKRFRVAGADPHRFDGDGNGVGCER